MATFSGNICLVLAALLSRELISSVYNYKPPHGGSGGAEAFPIWMLLIHVGFLALMGIVTVAIASKGGFDWVASNRMLRYFLVSAGLLLAVTAMLLSALTLNSAGSVPALLQFTSRFVPAAVPIILVLTGFVLLNPYLRNAVPAVLYRIPLLLVFGVGLLYLGGLVVDSIGSKGKNVDREYENSAEIKASRLREIADADPEADLPRLLEFSGGIYPPEVQEKAAAKIKSSPDWQQKLVSVLENDRPYGAFAFFAANDVDDKKQFVQAVNAGVLNAAYWVRHDIQGTSPSAHHTDDYSGEVANVLRTVEKFEGQGIDYLPAVRELRSALDEPVHVKGFQFECATVLDAWIKKRQ